MCRLPDDLEGCATRTAMRCRSQATPNTLAPLHDSPRRRRRRIANRYITLSAAEYANRSQLLSRMRWPPQRLCASQPLPLRDSSSGLPRSIPKAARHRGLQILGVGERSQAALATAMTSRAFWQAVDRLQVQDARCAGIDRLSRQDRAPREVPAFPPDHAPDQTCRLST